MLPQFDRIRRAMNAAQSQKAPQVPKLSDSDFSGDRVLYVCDIRDHSSPIHDTGPSDLTPTEPFENTFCSNSPRGVILSIFRCKSVLIPSSRSFVDGQNDAGEANSPRDQVIATLESELDQLRHSILERERLYESFMNRICECVMFDSAKVRIRSDELYIYRYVMLTKESLEVYLPDHIEDPILLIVAKSSPFCAKISLRDNEIRFYSLGSTNLLLSVRLSPISSSKYLTCLKILGVEVSIVDVSKSDGILPQESSRRVISSRE